MLKNTSKKFKYIASYLLESLVIIFAISILLNYGYQGTASLFLASLITPVALGLIIGLVLDHRSFAAILAMYLVSLLVATTSQIRSRYNDDLKMVSGIEFGLRDYPYYDKWFVVIIIVVATLLLLIVGRWVGQRINKNHEISPQMAKPSYIESIVKDSSRQTDHMRRFTESINAIAPLLTLIATIIGGVLTYLAATHVGRV